MGFIKWVILDNFFSSTCTKYCSWIYDMKPKKKTGNFPSFWQLKDKVLPIHG